MKRRVFLASAIAAVTGTTAPRAASRPDIRPKPLPPRVVANRIVVHKMQRQLILWADDQVLRTYSVALGFGEPGPKRREGDGRTPEGRYRIDGRNPNSAFHLSLHISYPEPHDIAAARAHGVPPGGAIMIHGLPRGRSWLGRLHLLYDWTAGCIAVTNTEIEEIWRVVPDGTPIEILA